MNFQLKKVLNERGAVAIYVALLMVVFLGIAALAIDIGYTRVARTELQRAADAAALAGARQMGQNYSVPRDPSTNVTSMAQYTASQNKAAGRNLAADNAVTSIRTWDPTQPAGQQCVNPTSPYPNAVLVTAKREGGVTSGPISTFFAPIFRLVNPSSPVTVNVEATACAALSGPCEATPGLPLGIGKSWFTHSGANNGCTTISVNATSSSCAGWTNLSTARYRWQDVRTILRRVAPGVPALDNPLHTGDEIEFGGGTVQNLVDDLLALFNRMKDPITGTWTTGVAVYEDNNTCVNPNDRYTIIGFATITVTGVITTGSNKGLQGHVDCNIANPPERGGCFYAGTYGAIPGLVQ